MLKDQLQKLFDNYDPAIKKIILGVLTVEQEHISMERPRVKDDIDAIVSSVANRELTKVNSEENA